jgi:hypothetical protein
MGKMLAARPLLQLCPPQHEHAAQFLQGDPGQELLDLGKSEPEFLERDDPVQLL